MHEKTIHERLGEPIAHGARSGRLRTADRISGWVSWLGAIGVNGFVVYMWVVFGLAAAGDVTTREVQEFIWVTGVGVALPLFASVWLVSRGRFAAAAGTVFLVMPLAFAIGALYRSLSMH